MSRSALFLVVAAILVGALLWWALGSGGGGVPKTYDVPERVAPPEPAPPPKAATEKPGFAVVKRRKVPPRTDRPARPTGPITETGDIVIRPVLAEGGALPEMLRIDLEPLGPRPSHHPLAVPQDDGSHRYEKIPVGPYRVRVFADTIVDAVGEVTVTADEEQVIEARLVPGAAVAFTATFTTGDPLPSVTLALLDGRGQPVSARFQARTPEVLTTPRVATSVELPAAAGVVMGLKPGRYTLKGESPLGGSDQQTFEASPGGTVQVDLRFAK